MARYHINPHTGNPGQCSARISCPYGNLATDHFDSEAEARAAYEAGNLDNAFSTLSKTLDEVVGPYADTPAGSPFASTRAFPQEDGVTIETSLVPATQLRSGDRVWDDGMKKTFTALRNDEGVMVLRAAGEPDDVIDPSSPSMEYRVDRVRRPVSDEAVSDGVAKTDWPRFDPAAGEGQLDQSGEYHVGGSDYAVWTDEAMGAYEQSPTAVFSTRTEAGEDGPVHHVSVNTGVHTFDLTTRDKRDVDAARRIAESGEWDYLVASPSSDMKAKVTTVGRYLRKRDAVGYIADAKLDVLDTIEALGDNDDDKSNKSRAEAKLDYELLSVAENVINAEARKGALDSSSPPF